MTKMVLKFNAVVGRSPIVEIEEITRRLSLRIENVREESPAAGKKFKVLDVTGAPGDLIQFREEMQRFPAVTAKLVDHA